MHRAGAAHAEVTQQLTSDVVMRGLQHIVRVQLNINKAAQTELVSVSVVTEQCTYIQPYKSYC